LTNNIYQIPDADVLNLLGYTDIGVSLAVQPISANGEAGKIVQAGKLASDAPYFVNGSQHMKQNLNFLIRAAPIDQLFFSLSNESGLDIEAGQYNQTSTNFEEFSFLHHCNFGSTGGAENLFYFQLDNLWPFAANYELANYLVNTSRTNGAGDGFYGSTNFTFTPNFATNVPAPPILAHADPYWILQLGFTAYIGSYGGSSPSSWGVSVNGGDTGASLSSGANLFSLPYENGCIVGITNSNVFSYQTLAPGNSVTTTPGYLIEDYASWCPAPTLVVTNYYFVPLVNPGVNASGVSGIVLPGEIDPDGGSNVQPFPVPIEDDFKVTNQTPPLIVGTVGQPMILGGWAKYSIQGSSPAKYAYLGQYFETNAFLLNSDGSTSTNSAGILSPYGEFFPLQAGTAALVTMPDIDSPYEQGTGLVRVVSLNVDANHDGTMDFSYAGPDQNSPSRPFRFWANDDQDAGDDGGNGGIPGVEPFYLADGYASSSLAPVPNPAPNEPVFQAVYRVHGTRDLVDFFPVYLNVGALFESNALSAGISVTDTNWQFILSQPDGVLRFVYTDLTPTNYMNYLRDLAEATNLANAITTTIISNGVAVSPSFVAGIATNNQGIILVEAAAPTTQPLALSIYHGTNKIAQTSLYLSISGVEQMFRSKTMLLYSEAGTVPDRLTDASVPNEPDTTDNNFIFLHGYNVSPEQARGWDADVYKRLYWSGSHAKFYGVTWTASDSQVAGQVTINLQTNILHAFNTAPLLNEFINSLSGTNIVAAHSLGNMVVLSTLNDYTNQSINTYFMIDAAVAIQAIDSNATSNADMYPTAWTNYGGNLLASGWHGLFPTNDYRSQLTWSSRLTNSQNAAVYNFYSSGEEVLRDYPADPPTSLVGIASGQFVSLMEGETGEYTWAWQEKLKGLMGANYLLSSDHGGWQFNQDYETNTVVDGVSYWEPMSPAAAAELTTVQLQTNAFFNFSATPGSSFPFNSDLALETSNGSNYAQTNQNRILSDAIPCLTLPVGANPVSKLSPPRNSTENNFDMQTVYENGWPLGRGSAQYPAGTTAFGEWHHSDVRAVAYTFTYQLFNQMVAVGNLK